MPWEPLQHTNTLLIQRREVSPGQYHYHLHPFFRRLTRDGESYMAPLSMLSFENSMLVFHDIDFIDLPRMPESKQDGDTVLCGSDYFQRLSLGE